MHVESISFKLVIGHILIVIQGNLISAKVILELLKIPDLNFSWWGVFAPAISWIIGTIIVFIVHVLSDDKNHATYTKGGFNK